MITDRLIEKIQSMNNPTVVGLDPRLAYVPGYIMAEEFEKHGETPAAAAEAFLRFNMAIIDGICDVVPAVKPQIAMYEQYGAAGIAAYISTIGYAREKGMLVIGDIKRGDIASTVEAYSDGHIGRVKIGRSEHEIYKEDFITLSPYLGYDSIEPYIQNCREFDKGLFILVKTSNPHSGELQDLNVGGELLYERMGRLVESWGEGLVGEHGYSAIGAVVGATHAEQARRLREIMPRTFFLVPGYGAQGGKAEDLAVCFPGAVVNSSRGIIAAYQSEKYRCPEREFASAARAAALDMREDLRRYCL